MGDRGAVAGMTRAGCVRIAVLGLLPLATCSDPSPDAGSGTGGTESTGMVAVSTTAADDGTTVVPSATTSTTINADDPDAGPGPSSSPPDADTTNGDRGEGCDFGTVGTRRGGYDFDNDIVCDVVQLDRVGVPHVGTLLISSRDAYNAATPVDDQALTFAMEINAGITALHAILDDALGLESLMTCAFVDCAAVVTPLVIPDALALDLREAPGFPNGRA
ncbi:MAG: hypothetical protein AAF721_36410, partial [Myxococcota bacterium]